MSSREKAINSLIFEIMEFDPEKRRRLFIIDTSPFDPAEPRDPGIDLFRRLENKVLPLRVIKSICPSIPYSLLFVFRNGWILTRFLTSEMDVGANEIPNAERNGETAVSLGITGP